MDAHRLTATALAEHRQQIAQAVTARHFQAHPQLAARFGATGSVKCREDTEYHLGFLEQAVARASPEIFADYLSWARIMLASRGIPKADLEDHLRSLLNVLRDMLPSEQMALIEAVTAPALTNLYTAAPAETVEDKSVAGTFLDTLRHGGPRSASAMVNGLMHNGRSIGDLYMDVMQPSLQEIGRLWQINEITVAEEHYLTAAIQMIMAQLYPQLFAKAPTRPSVVTACSPGELHEIGARMVADLLQFEGFDSHFVGASTPARDLVDFVVAKRAVVVGLSTTIAPNLAQVEQTIRALRADSRSSDVKIVVGGGPFTRIASLWKTIGADAFASDAREAVGVFKALAT